LKASYGGSLACRKLAAPIDVVVLRLPLCQDGADTNRGFLGHIATVVIPGIIGEESTD